VLVAAVRTSKPAGVETAGISSPTLEQASRNAVKAPILLNAAAVRKNSLRLKYGDFFDCGIF
jgi:hypothetical protein